MKKALSVLIILVLSLSIISCSLGEKKNQEDKKPVDAVKNPEEIRVISEAFYKNLIAGDYHEAIKDFSPKMLEAINADKLKETWEKLVGPLGKYKGQISLELLREKGYDRVHIISAHEKTGIITQLVFDDNIKISGLWFNYKKIDEKMISETPGDFEEMDITIGKEWPLPGILTLPKGNGPFPVLVLVHGSGPNDRDETVGQNKPFRDLAHGLAKQGIGVLRYDKRTLVHGERIVNTMMDTLTIYEETIEDALLAVNLMTITPKIDKNRIYVLGHSQGGIAAPRMGQLSQDIAGLVIMAGSPRHLGDIIMDQARYMLSLEKNMSDSDKEGLIQQQQQEIDRIKALRTMEDAKEKLYLGIPAAFWVDLNNYDIPGIARQIDQPMLILHGERDFQVYIKDFELWKDVLKDKNNLDYKLYPKLNHLFMEGEGLSTVEEYYLPNNIPEYVIDDIANWIRKAR